VLALLATLLSSTPAASQRITRGDVPAPIAIAGVTVIDVANGTRLKKQTVVVRGTRIAAIGRRRVRIPSGARVIDGRGRFLIPGLWDVHVHSAASVERDYSIYVALGIIGVRDGPILDGAGSNAPGAVIVRNAEQARRAVDSLAAGGAEVIELSDFLRRDAFFGAVTQARHHGLSVTGRVPYSVSVVEAAEGGLSSVEHLRGFAFDCSPIGDSLRAEVMSLAGEVAAGRAARPALDAARERALAAALSTRDDARCTRSIEMVRRHGTWVVPALGNGWREREGSPRSRAERANIALFRHAGVPLLAGTDVGDSGRVVAAALHDELEQLAAAGLGTAEALRAATMNPARFLRLGDGPGTMEAGDPADLVLLDADPLADIRNTRRIRAVIASGQLYDRKALNALLAEPTPAK
jgi:hypothetical protein